MFKYVETIENKLNFSLCRLNNKKIFRMVKSNLKGTPHNV